jgi:hypothetical protein
VKLKTSTTFRALSLSFGIHISSMNLPCKKPTHTTLLNWIHKIGYYELTKTKEKADDWILLLDESIQLGQDKVLVIFGIREKDIDFSRPLNFQDLTPLREITKEKWNGDLIKETLLDLKEEIGNVKYAVGDYGSDLHKGLRLAEIPHIHDLTHKIALFLEKKYQNNEQYNEISKNMSDMRVKLGQSKIAHIIPPKQRKKSRYQNIKTISDWCIKTIRYIENDKTIENEIFDKLKWLLDYNKFVEELSEINTAINTIEKILKYSGFSALTEESSLDVLSKIKSGIGYQLHNEMKTYFSETKNLLPDCQKILLSSDIIESGFGKYKNYVSLNPMAGVTNLILCISAFTASLEKSEIKKALESVTINDIKNWTKEFVGKTLLQKRRAVLNN